MSPQYREFLYKRASIICTGCHVTNVANKPLVSVSVFDMRVPRNSVLRRGCHGLMTLFMLLAPLLVRTGEPNCTNKN